MDINYDFNKILYEALHAGEHEEFSLTLNSPMTEEQWDTFTDVDLDHTDNITFHTKHGKEVKFVKPKTGQWMTTYLDHDAAGVRPKMFYCSKCNQCVPFPMSYCPACGSHNSGGEA